MIPKWLSHALKAKDLEVVSEAVAEAESRTSGEIVPTIVRSSAAVDHIPLTLFLLVFSFVLLFILFVVELLWSAPNGMAVAISAILGLAVLPLARDPRVQRMFTSRADRKHQALMRAQIEFYQADISHTSGKTGVLLFVSMMERQAVVLADKSIAEKLPPETWDRVIEVILKGVRQGELALGLKQAIHMVGEILTRHFPQISHETNEVSNELVIKE